LAVAPWHFDGVSDCIDIWLENAGSSHMVKAKSGHLEPQRVHDLAAIIANSSKNKLTTDAPIVSAAVQYRGLVLRAQIVAPPATASGKVLSFRVFRHDQTIEPKRFRFLRNPDMSMEAERRKKMQGIRDLAYGGDEETFLKAED
jgi:type IV secretion system protein VirB11